jgi:DNA-binding MarR family transcriptional regulator
MLRRRNPPAAPVPATHRVPQHLARRFLQVSDAWLAELFAPHDLVPWQYALLVQVCTAPGLDRARLAAAIGRDATSTGQALDGFEARGWVERRIAPGDRRAWAFHPAPAGLAFRDALLPATKEVARRLLSPLSAAEAETFMALFTRLVEAHEAHARPGAGRRPPRRRHSAAATGAEGVMPPCPPPSPAGPFSGSASPSPRDRPPRPDGSSRTRRPLGPTARSA